MKLFPIARPLVLATVLIASFASAQATKTPPSCDEIVALHQAGVSSEDLLGILATQGVPTLAAADITRLEKAGVNEAVIKKLKSAVPTATTRTIGVEDVKLLASSGVPEAQILALVESAVVTAPPTAEQVLELVRAGVPASVIKALRAKAVAPSTLAPAVTAPTLEDLPRLAREGVGADVVVKRIRESDARFDVNVDQLVVLTRQGVPGEVLKEVWARRRATTTSGNDAGTTPAGATSTTPLTPTPESRPVATFSLHKESAGGFSVLAPGDFAARREARGANALVTFTKGEPDATGLADAEISVFRYRSTAPERLVETNLTPIANDFLNRLRASYASRKLTAVFGDPRPTRLAGRPAIVCRASTSAADGTVHSGEIAVTWSGDQIFVISTAARTDQPENVVSGLSTCLRSFAVDAGGERPAPAKDDAETVAALAETWRTAVTSRNAALYDALCGDVADAVAHRTAFTTLCDRICHPDRRLVMEPATSNDGVWTVPCRILGGNQPEAVTLRFAKRDGKFVLATP